MCKDQRSSCVCESCFRVTGATNLQCPHETTVHIKLKSMQKMREHEPEGAKSGCSTRVYRATGPKTRINFSGGSPPLEATRILGLVGRDSMVASWGGNGPRLPGVSIAIFGGEMAKLKEPVYLSSYLSIYLSIYLSFFLSFFLPIFLSVNLFIYPSLPLATYHQATYLPTSPSIYLSIFFHLSINLTIY